jgi:hypothetical protein
LFHIFISDSGSVISISLTNINWSLLFAAKLSDGLFPGILDGVINHFHIFLIIFLLDSLHLFHIVDNFLSQWHDLFFHLSICFLQILLKRMGGVLPGVCNVFNLVNVDFDGNLLGLNDVQKKTDD